MIILYNRINWLRPMAIALVTLVWQRMDHAAWSPMVTVTMRRMEAMRHGRMVHTAWTPCLWIRLWTKAALVIGLDTSLETALVALFCPLGPHL